MRNKKAKRHFDGPLGDAVCVVIGCALMAASIAVFNVPNDIAPGGVSGLATALAQVVPSVSVGAWMMVLNLPLLLAAWKLLSRHTLVMTLIAASLLSAFADLFGTLTAG